MLVKQSSAQEKEVPVQFTGVTASDDNRYPIPYVTVLVKGRFAGTVSDSRGFFSFVALAGDTVQFSAIGYRTTYAKIPKDIKDNEYSIVQLMERDTIQLRVVDVYPWPSKRAFREAFVSLELPSDDYDLAASNLQNNLVRELALKMGMDATENQRYLIQKEINRIYYAGSQQGIANVGGGSVPIPSSLLNPLAWADFFKALRSGAFKQK